MKILIAEDDPVSRRVLQAALEKWGHEVIATSDGAEALKVLEEPDAPRMAILDWMMPRMDGVEVCRSVREIKLRIPTYIILLTAKGLKDDIVEGLESGANDYVTKPFHRPELRSRVQVGVRMVELQTELAHRVAELEKAINEVKTLRGLFPMCSYCKKIRDDSNFWTQVECYLMEHSEAEFSHGICPDCYEKVVQPELDKLNNEKSS